MWWNKEHSEENYIGKYKSQYDCTFGLELLLFLLDDLKDKYVTNN